MVFSNALLGVALAAQPLLDADFVLTLPQGAWIISGNLRAGISGCTADSCEAGYTRSGFYVLARRVDEQLRVSAGFRGCKPEMIRISVQLEEASSAGRAEQLGIALHSAARLAAQRCGRRFVAYPSLSPEQLGFSR